jgi:hypothetical protein
MVHRHQNMGIDLGRCARREGFEPPTPRSVAWCSASTWTSPDRSGLLTLDALSVQRDPDGSCRIVWMIKQARQLDQVVGYGH